MNALNVANVQIGNIQIGNDKIGNEKIRNAEIGRMEWPFSATVVLRHLISLNIYKRLPKQRCSSHFIRSEKKKRKYYIHSPTPA